MCGRYTITITEEELMLRFMLENSTPVYAPRYNVAPGQMVPAIINDGKQNKLGQLRWGLIPSWAKDTKIGYKMINARVETVAEKPAYRTSLVSKRCIIPADGFYEWKIIEDGKQPMRILLKGGELFGMAGLYDTWVSPEGEKISSCSIITTGPNKTMEGIHDRMPVILRKEDEATWLDRSIQDVKLLQTLIEKPYPDEKMRVYPVTKAVGNVKNDSAENIQEVS
ncbi:Putative SOS response-associated peptidase YedK [Paenibacillus sp. 1_12]|uniref:SOS response-associated peptidase n=1 Tax=Paenibacillus sp. 1_12 TaxID=1566278 RepID=UPI0008F1ED8A|nr:SOS response-associated peptidase [Paenibacillus sp. 1_12]SFL59775.1 Putative SOS response-associated peptidase YedK [Paenibacillus sp. 1_12]